MKLWKWLKKKFKTTSLADQYMGLDWGFDTWKCDSCSTLREDKDISVLTYKVTDNSLYTAQVNHKYCNDREICRIEAYRRAVNGTF